MAVGLTFIKLGVGQCTFVGQIIEDIVRQLEAEGKYKLLYNLI